MFIRSVTAHAFGPLVGQTLEFADGMTVVHGPNESAKSSWHAAIYAALCGRRRGRGRLTTYEQEFADRHRPWDRPDWLVGARLLLDDGRRVELRQDLSGLVACDAVDLDLGRDCSAEIMHDDTPDAARWLGLDRTSLPSTAFVTQAQLLDVLDRADGLRTHLQRAASTAAADHTAAAALRRIEQFQAEQVGTDRAPTKPLRRATHAVQQADDALAGARADHQAYERRLLALAGLRAESDEAEQAVRRRAAAVALGEARRAGILADEAATVAQRLAGPTPPAPPTEDLVAAVSSALHDWASAGVADRAADASVGVAAMTGSVAVRSSGPARAAMPVPLTVPEPRAAWEQPSDEELYQLARALDEAPPEPDPELAEALARAEVHLAERIRSDRRRTWFNVAAWAVLAGGLLLYTFTKLAPPLHILGLVAVLAGIPLVLAGALTLLAARDHRAHAVTLVQVIAARMTENKDAAASAAARHDEAVARATSAGLPTDPASLRNLVPRRAEERAVRGRDAHWHEQVRSRAEQRLLAAAVDVGRPAATPAQAKASLLDWQRDQAQAADDRARVARDSAELAGRLGGLSLAELHHRAALAQQRAAHLTTLARATASTASTASTVDNGTASGGYRYRSPRLGVGPEAGEKGVAAGPEAADPDGGACPHDDVLDRLRDEARTAAHTAQAAEVSLCEWVAGIVPVGEAEEELSRAEAELTRVRELDDTLALARRFLLQAQETAHRTIAPRLASAVAAWLPATTGGRYTEVMVDPERLRVKVRGPASRWRDAGLLSYGTTEQIYLMLRIALAQHLSRPGTSCPLLLDDVTVHADATRTDQLLELLLQASDDRQIILFTQEDRVAAWAGRTLSVPRHAVIELTEIPAA